ncbi:MAG: SDR family oxidoreductase [Williamsia herbipolensis]|nr:SDR family oxidoreductase [Williamsia herbipolensis]
MGRVDGKVVLISGGARGMGAAHARALVAEGARVVLGDILDEEGAALATEIGGAARYVHLDVTQPDQWTDAVAAASETFGSLTGLVNNAGIVNGSTLQKFKLEKWQQILDVNLTGTFLGMRAAADAMIAAGGGSIVNVSSVEGLQGSPWAHGYVASKWAVRGITKSAALELAAQDVRVNSIHPGLIRTPMTEGIPDGMLKIPMNRSADPSEVAAFVVFLMSDESSYATGTEFVMDGGLTAGTIA